MALIAERLDKLPHLSIEDTGRVWAQRYFERRGGDLSQVVLVVAKDQQVWLDLPGLMGENCGIRYDDCGFLYTLRWHPKAITAVNSQDFQLIHPRPQKVRGDYLDNIPANRSSVAVLQFACCDDIETAIRQQEHVLQQTAADGQARQVITFTDSLVEALLGNEIEIDQFEQRTTDFLAQAGLLWAQAPDKIKIALMLEKAMDRDSLGRENELVKRIRIRSAYLAAVRRLVVNSLIQDKYTANKIMLEYEKEITCWAIRGSVDIFQRLLGHTGFRTGRQQTLTQRQIINRILMETTEDFLTMPRVRPYLAPARIAGISVLGCRQEDQPLQRLVIGGDDWVDELFELTPVTELVSNNDFAAARDRIRKINQYLTPYA